MKAEGNPAFSRQRFQTTEPIWFNGYRDKTESKKLIELCRIKPGQNHNRGSNPRFSELDPLLQRGHAEAVAALMLQSFGNFASPMTVSIRLYYGEDLYLTTDFLSHLAEIPAQGRQIDGAEGGASFRKWRHSRDLGARVNLFFRS